MLQLFSLMKLLKDLVWLQFQTSIYKWFQLLETQHSHLNQLLMLPQWSLFMSKLLKVQRLAIQSEEKKNIKPGPKILKTMATTKKRWLIPESHMHQQWCRLKWSQLLETMLSHHNLPHHIQLLIFHSMSSSLLLQALDIQLEEKRTGNNGLKILKIGESNKKMLPTPESHMLLRESIKGDSKHTNF